MKGVEKSWVAYVLINEVAIRMLNNPRIFGVKDIIFDWDDQHLMIMIHLDHQNGLSW